MFKFPVTPKKEKELMDRLNRLHLNGKDFSEQFTPSSGSGGQRVNKASTSVRITHLPTGLTVRYQGTRSQGLNRFFAWRLLLEKIENEQLGTPTKADQSKAKIRRQKKRRARRARDVKQDRH